MTLDGPGEPLSPPPPSSPPTGGLAIGALVLGILALLFGVFFPPFAFLLGGISIVLGIMARRRVARGEAGGAGVALAGILSSVAGILIGILMLALFVNFFSQISACIDPEMSTADVEECIEAELGG